MHLVGSTATNTTNMATIMRRIPANLRAQSPISSLPVRNYSHFRPVYSINTAAAASNQWLTAGQRHHADKQQRFNQTIRWAGTSSNIYAPSTMAHHTNRNLMKGTCGTRSVYESSDHLPSLPVSDFNIVLEKLKESISPVAMNSAEFVQTLELIDKFSRSAGPKLDLLLRHKAGQVKNWMTHDWWTQQAYLKSREPLVINSNPAMIYPTFPFEVENQRALVNVISQLVSGIIEFKLALIHGYNPEAINADNELRLDTNQCYNQYQQIFGSTRMPGEQVDVVRSEQIGAATDIDGPFKIVISHRGKFYEIQLNDIEDEVGRIDKLASVLDKIVGSQHLEENEEVNVDDQALNGPGVLTATRRNEWASAYKLLDPESMEAIQEAQFVVCIDTIPTNNPDQFSRPLFEAPVGSERHSAALGRQILHGDSVNIGNRWFDKSFQLIVVADDKLERLLGAGINYEHSMAEGIVVSKMIEYSYDRAVQKNRDASKANFFSKQQLQLQKPTVFRQLKMFDRENNVDQIVEHLRQAKLNFLAHVDQFDLSHMAYKRYGSNSIKSWKFSPDSWFQVALLSAYYNLHKRLRPCYETASTRRFAYGRTETIRSLTKEVANYCLEPKFENLHSAIKSHKSYANSANSGNAIDRVLMGYKMAFNELRGNNWSWGLPSGINQDVSNGVESQDFELQELFTENELNTIIAFFNNELIKRSTCFALSTSQVSSIHPNICMSYGPILADGYGCCYNITGQQIVAAITANSSNQSFSCEVHELNDSLRGSLNSMRDIVEEQRSKSNK